MLAAVESVLLTACGESTILEMGQASWVLLNKEALFTSSSIPIFTIYLFGTVHIVFGFFKKGIVELITLEYV